MKSAGVSRNLAMGGVRKGQGVGLRPNPLSPADAYALHPMAGPTDDQLNGYYCSSQLQIRRGFLLLPWQPLLLRRLLVPQRVNLLWKNGRG